MHTNINKSWLKINVPNGGSGDDWKPERMEEVVHIENAVFTLRSVQQRKERIHGKVAGNEENKKSIGFHLQ